MLPPCNDKNSLTKNNSFPVLSVSQMSYLGICKNQDQPVFSEEMALYWEFPQYMLWSGLGDSYTWV